MHPYASQAKSSSASKFKGMTGKKSGGAVHSDEAQDRKLFAKMIKDKRAEGGRVPGKAAGGRLDKAARGGVIKKNYGGALMGPGPGLMPGAIPPQAGLPPQAMATLPPQAMMGGARPYKRGGRTKPAVNIKIVSLPGEKATPPLPAALPPPGLAAAGLPPVAPGGGLPLRPPGPPMARGGRTHTGGDNGVGRLEKAAAIKKAEGGPVAGRKPLSITEKGLRSYAAGLRKSPGGGPFRSNEEMADEGIPLPSSLKSKGGRARG